QEQLVSCRIGLYGGGHTCRQRLSQLVDRIFGSLSSRERSQNEGRLAGGRAVLQRDLRASAVRKRHGLSLTLGIGEADNRVVTVELARAHAERAEPVALRATSRRGASSRRRALTIGRSRDLPAIGGHRAAAADSARCAPCRRRA